MINNGAIVGTMEVERKLPVGNDLHDNAHFGGTLDFAVCAQTNRKLECFPFRSTHGKVLHDLPTEFNGKPIPVYFALTGKTGIVHATDYRGTQVIAAHQPLGSLGLGAVLKIDAEDLYSPIKQKFVPLFFMLLGLGSFAMFLLRLQFIPMVRKLTSEIEIRKTTEAKLEQSRAELAEITSNLGEGVYVLDEQGIITFINPVAERLLGWTASEIIGKKGPEIFHGKDPDGTNVAQDKCIGRQTLKTGKIYRDLSNMFVCKDGSSVPVSIVSSPIVRNGKIEGAIVSFDDITQRLALDQSLRESEERYRLVLENAADAVIIINPEKHVVYVNKQAQQMLGYSIDELLALSVFDLLPPEEIQTARSVIDQLEKKTNLRFEIKLKREDCSFVPVEINAVKLSDGNFFGACRDITERKNYESQLEYQATHDALTGLANRDLLTDRIEQSIAHARRSGKLVAVILLDLDRFKLINDTLGHATGDALLQETAKRLLSSVRSGDTVARLGGDEFMLIISDMASEDNVGVLARNLLNIVAKPMEVAAHEIVITASLGVSIYPRDAELAPILFKNADIAMYRAKELGRNSFQFYAPAMNSRMLERLELENGLRRALENKELELYYQPKVSLRHGNMVGAEALIRWNHPVAGIVSPGDFIPLAEETGLIIPIGEWVLEAACEQIKIWQDQGLSDIAVAVNLSARQFQQENLTQVIEKILGASGVQARFLELEVTESSVMVNPEKTIAILHELKKIGVKIALDDFGTGYSSLSYLKRFPIDSLKIDQSFVRDIISDPDDAAIAKLVISLAHSLKQTVIAEGVENEAQLRFLQRNQCDEMQGYYFSRPLPAEEFTSLLQKDKRLELATDTLDVNRTILIVDDEAHIISAIKRLLRPEGYRILTASSAAEGMELLALHPVQVIISDQRMPEMNGTDFLNLVWQMYPDTIRILLTGYTDLKSVTDAVNKGAILKFLTKPWEDDQLKEHVREAFRYYDSTGKI